MSIAVEDWDDLSAVPRRREKQAPAERAGSAPATGRQGVGPADWDELSTARRRHRERKAEAAQADEAPATDAEAPLATDWDDLPAARRRRGKQAVADQAAAEPAEDAPASRT
ncbi:MAG: hypothetical protein M3Q31_14270, partial [Actinomycetota bacterium]|nr:hypothetical protein [Actinomycetota bacterium]